MNIITVVIVLIIILSGVSGRGGKDGRDGGGGGGEFRIKRYAPASGFRYSNYNSAVKAGVVVSGISRYRSRFRGTGDYKEDPSICFTLHSGTFDNGTKATSLGYFVCPYKAYHTAEQSYCCGPGDYEKCCRLWDDHRRAILISCCVALGLCCIGAIIKLCCLADATIICGGNGRHQPETDHSREISLHTSEEQGTADSDAHQQLLERKASSQTQQIESEMNT